MGKIKEDKGMNITDVRLDALKVAIREAQDATWRVDVHTINGLYERKQPLKWGVNWAAYGTMPAEKAVEFATWVTRAAGIADMLSGLEITRIYKDDEMITSKETWEEAVKAMTEAILKNDLVTLAGLVSGR